MYYNFSSKTILVVGGSSGIGKAVAAMAHAAGAHIILTGRDAAKARSAALELSPEAEWRILDVNDEASVTDCFQSLPKLDHLYLAAGTAQMGSLTEADISAQLAAFDTRFAGSIRVLRAAIPQMNPGGSITFTGGISTDRPFPGAWVSGVGTAVAEQLARVLVMDYPHIRFNAVSPGYTDTPMWDRLLGEQKTEVLNRVAEKLPVKQIARAEDVAAAVLFLMSNASVTGEIIHVDGGGRLM